MNNLFIFFKMAINIAESALKCRVSRVSGNTDIFFRPNTIDERLSIKLLNSVKRINLWHVELFRNLNFWSGTRTLEAIISSNSVKFCWFLTPNRQVVSHHFIGSSNGHVASKYGDHMTGVTVYLAPLDSLPPGGQAVPGYLTPHPGYLHPRGASCPGRFILPPTHTGAII